jgi:hypothetical protein
MPANTSPIFTAVPNTPSVTINAANTARDGSGTLFTLFTAGANGSLVTSITFTNAQAAAGASALKVVRIFITDTAGANPKLFQELLLPAVTASNTVIGATVSANIANGIPLKAGQIIKVAQSLCATAADNTDVFAIGGDY